MQKVMERAQDQTLYRAFMNKDRAAELLAQARMPPRMEAAEKVRNL